MRKKLFAQSDKVTIEQNMQALEKKLNSTQNAILGGNISFIPMITDSDGKLSDEKIESLAEEMVKALREYVTPYGEPESGEIPSNYHLESHFFVPDESSPVLDVEDGELNKSFAYCAICVAANKQVFNGTFGDILDIAANRAYAVESEYYWNTDDSLEIFGNLVCCALGTDVLSEYYTKSNHPMGWGVESDEASYKDAETRRNTIPNPEKFISEFKKYVSLNHDKLRDRNHIDERKNMIMTYLYKKRLTVLALGDDYSTIENIVENFRDAIETECSDRTPVSNV